MQRKKKIREGKRIKRRLGGKEKEKIKKEMRR